MVFGLFGFPTLKARDAVQNQSKGEAKLLGTLRLGSVTVADSYLVMFASLEHVS